MGFKSDRINKAAVPKGTSLNYREKPTTSSKILHTSQAGKFAGRTTGDYLDQSDGRWWQVILTGTNALAWVREDVTSFQKPPSDPALNEKDVQGIVDKLVNNDIEVYHSLLRSSALLKDAAAKGKDVSSFQKAHAQLNARLEARQDKIKNSKLLSWKEGIKKGYENLKKSYINYVTSPEYHAAAMMNVYGIGSITGVVIGAVIGAGLIVGAYFAFKPKYDESTADLKISKDLEAALATLTPEKAAEVKADLEKQIDTAYNQGKTDQFISTNLKWIGFAALGFFGISFLMNQSRRNE